VIRGVGLVLIVVLCVESFRSSATGGPPDLTEPGVVSAAIFAVGLFCFLWLFATGTFGFGSFVAGDARAFFPLAVGLVTRLCIVTPGNMEETAYFPIAGLGQRNWQMDDHSIVFASLKAAFVSIFGRTDEGFVRVNGVVGALAIAAMFLFVRRRFEDGTLALFASLLMAVSPLLSRYAPTDSHFSLLLFFWFTGLALLGDATPRPAQLVSGFICLGLAGACRAEGPIYFLSALPFVRWAPLLSSSSAPLTRAGLWGGAAGGGISLLNAVQQIRNVWGHHDAGQTGGLRLVPWRFLTEPLVILWDGHRGDLPFVLLFVVGVWAAFRDPRRFGFLRWALLVALVDRAIVGRDRMARVMADSLEHKLPFFIAMEALMAGGGAAWLIDRLRPTVRRSAVPVLAGLLAVASPILGYGEMTRVTWFNAEYRLLHDDLPKLHPPRGCVLLWFGTGDMELRTLAVYLPNAPGVVDTRDLNCMFADCGSVVARGQCAYFLESNSCRRQESLLTDLFQSGGPFRMHPGSSGAEPCARFMKQTALEEVASRTAGDDRFAIYRVLGRREGSIPDSTRDPVGLSRKSAHSD
jgi:hypothetical protein